MKKNKKREIRKIIFLSVFCYLLLQGAIFTFLIGQAYGLKNGSGYNESSASKYNFEKNYGSHDWVADSALRLIYEQEGYRGEIAWLYNPQYTDYKLSGVVDGNDGWWSYNDLKANNKKWIYDRRYLQMLWGTYIPDKVGGVVEVIREESAPKDSTKSSYPFIWAASTCNSPGKPHHTYFSKLNKDEPNSDYIWNLYNSNNKRTTGIAPLMVLEAAIDALLFLNKKNEESNIKGMYEAAAICIGGMTHFFGDMAIPGHVLDSSIAWGRHNQWENYIQTELNTKHNSEKNGPDYTVLQPIQDIKDKLNLAVKPIFPLTALLQMAELSFAAGDKPEQNLEAEALDNNIDNLTPEQEERIEDLLSYAVYYSACAILWVCDLIDWSSRGDTTENLDKSFNDIEIKPLPADDLRKWRQLQLGSFNEGLDNWLNSLGINLNMAAGLSSAVFLIAPLTASAIFVIWLPSRKIFK